MARRNRSPEEIERRAKIGELLQLSNVISAENIQNQFRETIAEFMEDSLTIIKDDRRIYKKPVAKGYSTRSGLA